jgi:hypothetical protein
VKTFSILNVVLIILPLKENTTGYVEKCTETEERLLLMFKDIELKWNAERIWWWVETGK